MMPGLLQRLDEIAASLAEDPDALALLALGSVGRDRHRLDEHSDLDFFVIADDKQRLLDDLTWLGEPLRWSHRDTPDGCKALVGEFFHEFAVFTPAELPDIRYEEGEIVWAREDFDTSLFAASVPVPHDAQWLTQEILANLYVGLHRWLRGERLAALRMVQGEALDNLLRLWGCDDPFNPSRRAETHGLPLSELVPGYDHTPAAAAAILTHLPDGTDAMAEEVRGLLARCTGT